MFIDEGEDKPHHSSAFDDSTLGFSESPHHHPQKTDGRTDQVLTSTTTIFLAFYYYVVVSIHTTLAFTTSYELELEVGHTQCMG